MMLNDDQCRLTNESTGQISALAVAIADGHGYFLRKARKAEMRGPTCCFVPDLIGRPLGVVKVRKH